MTLTGAYNTNNTIVIKDSGIAAAFEAEFEQMWGSSGDKPNAGIAKFHKDKEDVGDHTYFVNDTKVELYFSPINRNRTKPSIMNRLVDVIHKEAQHDVAFQTFAITPSIPLSQTIWQMSATGSVALYGIIDPLFYYRYKSNGDIWASPESRLSNRMILPANEMRKLHDKVMLLDANNPDPSDKGIVIAGSYNFSNNAEVNNDENLLIIYSDRISNQYYQDFRGVLRRARHKGNIPAPPIDSDQWYSVDEVSDGSQFAIEVLPGFEYGVEFLGVDVPRVYAGDDLSEYYSAEASEYLRNLISGARVRLQGPSGDTPKAKYGAFQAYVTLKKDGKNIALNKHLLQQGFGQYDSYYAQNPDSVGAFKEYAQNAKLNKLGIWRHPQKIGKKFSRAKVIDEGSEPSDAFPININTADEAMLDLLPGIGTVYAGRIIAYRNKNGAFSNVDQLENIKGIGPKTMQKLRPNVVVE
jgi:competence ComEA-like helix-hairpin-helix protein